MGINSSSDETATFRENKVKNITADVLVPSIAKSMG